jgi:hypothetical protein
MFEHYHCVCSEFLRRRIVVDMYISYYILYLAEQDSYQLVRSTPADDHRLIASQVPRLKLSAING